MRCGSSIILTISLVCSLILAAQYSILAQTPDSAHDKQYKNDQEPPRAMIQRLQQENEDMQAEIAKNPSSPEAEKLERKIQWNRRKMRELLPGAVERAESKEKAKKGKAPASGLERYMVIAQKNLFTPLGSGREVKRQEFVVTGILGSDARRAFIRLTDGSMSYYVSEGESIGNDTKVTHIGKDSVTIVHEGDERELKLDKSAPIVRSQGIGGRKSAQRGEQSSKKSDEKRMEAVSREEENRMKQQEEKYRQEPQEREKMEKEIRDLYRVRDEVEQKIMAMEGKGHVDYDVYREKAEAIDNKIRDLEFSLR